MFGIIDNYVGKTTIGIRGGGGLVGFRDGNGANGVRLLIRR